MIKQEHLTFLILSKDEEQLLWCIKNIRYKNNSRILVCHEGHNKVTAEICARYTCHVTSNIDDAQEKFKLDPTRYLIVIDDTTRVSQFDHIPDHSIIGSIKKGCLIVARDKINDLNIDLTGEDWHLITDVSNREWWNYPKDDYPILNPCILKDAKCKFSPT